MQRRLHSTNHSPTYYTTETNDTATLTTTATKSYIKAYLRTSRASYNPSISASPTNPSLHYVSCLQTPVKDEHEPRNIQGAVYKINCSDCRNVSNYCQQQSFSRLHPPRRSNYTIALGFFFNRRATFPPGALETCREPSKHLSKQNAWISARKTRSTTTGRGFIANFSRTKYARPNMVFSVAQLFFSTFPSFQTLLLVKLLVRLHKNSRSNSVSSCPGS